MNYFDWLIICLYLAAVIVLAVYLTRFQQNTADYYLGGKQIKWWQSGASTMATQLSAISFVSAPAFVALKQNGGLKWLAYEFGVPLALILVMALIIPILHRRNYISIYEYLEERFDSGTRTLVSLLFQLGRGLATAVAVLAGGLIISTALNISTELAILLIGLITVIYDAIGGIRVVILSDFMQMMIILAGLAICGGVAIYFTGWQHGWQLFPPERLQILDFEHWGFTSQGTYGFWPMLIGGFFLYASYYGCDQSQVQRELSVRTVDDVRKSLLVNAFGRFPLVLLYTLMGVFVGAAILTPDGLAKVAATLNTPVESVRHILQNNPDRMVPMFILSFLPHGIIGFIFVAIMAALMSSLDSGINSLSAATMKDFYQRFVNTSGSEKHYLIASKIITFLWGVFCIAVALLLADSGDAVRQTTIVLINAMGSMLYGPILAAFLLGMLTRHVDAQAVKAGVLSGVFVNALLWLFTPVSWMWWNVSGFLVTGAVTLLYALFSGERPAMLAFGLVSREVDSTAVLNWRRIYWLVAGYFILIVLVAYLIQG